MPRKKKEKFEFEGRVLLDVAGRCRVIVNGDLTAFIFNHLRDITGEEMKLDREMFNKENGIGK